MLTQLYHGSSRFEPRGGYAGGKPNNFQYGIGLYTTNSYQWASNYGRRMYVLTVDLDPAKASHNVEIPINILQSWVNVFCTKKLAKIFKDEFQYRDTMTAERFEIFLHWHIKSFTKLAVPLANFFAQNNVTHTIELGDYASRLVRIFDFDIITHSTFDKAAIEGLAYSDTVIPDEVERYKKYKISID